MNSALRIDDCSIKLNRVLIVDDDPATRRMVTSYLEERSFEATSVAGRQELRLHLGTRVPSVILLNLSLAQDDGLELLREVRSNSDVPVILMSGQRIDEIDRVVGLELGADDCLTKPFGLGELLARIRAVLRRHELGRRARTREPQRGGYHFGGWRLHCDDRRLLAPDGAPVTLTKGEYALLVAFLQAPRRALTREQLLQATRVHEDIFDRSIDVQVLRLRRKLQKHTGAPHMIRTLRGVGYEFALAAEQF